MTQILKEELTMKRVEYYIGIFAVMLTLICCTAGAVLVVEQQISLRDQRLSVLEKGQDDMKELLAEVRGDVKVLLSEKAGGKNGGTNNVASE